MSGLGIHLTAQIIHSVTQSNRATYFRLGYFISCPSDNSWTLEFNLLLPLSSWAYMEPNILFKSASQIKMLYVNTTLRAKPNKISILQKISVLPTEQKKNLHVNGATG